MSDILVQLRACNCGIHCKSGCIQEKAACEIERLRAALQEIVAIDPGRVTLAHGIARAALSAGTT